MPRVRIVLELSIVQETEERTLHKLTLIPTRSARGVARGVPALCLSDVDLGVREVVSEPARPQSARLG